MMRPTKSIIITAGERKRHDVDDGDVWGDYDGHDRRDDKDDNSEEDDDDDKDRNSENGDDSDADKSRASSVRGGKIKASFRKVSP